MKPVTLLTIFLTALLSTFSCKSEITKLENTPAGRRDYVWTVDTLNYPENTLRRMWASSPTDVWATSLGDFGKNIFHYDGEKWVYYSISGMNSPMPLWGENSNNVFVAGAAGVRGEVWKFNGSNWSYFSEISKDEYRSFYLNNIWGKNVNDFYVFGGSPDTIIVGGLNNSVIAHYYNNKMEVLNTSSVSGAVVQLYEDYNSNRIYFNTTQTGNGKFYDSTLVYEYYQGKFSKLYGSIWTGGEQAFLGHINNEVYFILGNKIAKRVDGKFNTILQIDNPNFFQRIWGRSSKDIFFFMLDGLVHYDGSNFEYLLRFSKPRTHIVGAAIFEKDVFFLVNEVSPSCSFIYHGKIN